MGHVVWDGADIDLFIVGDNAMTVRGALGVLQRNIDAATGGRTSIVLRTKNTLTVVGGHPLPNVQLVCKTVRSCQELLVHSDVDCTAMAYDGANVLATTRALRAIVTGYNFVPRVVLVGSTSRHGKSLARFNKYHRRGFGILIFEHCRHVPRCDHSVPDGALRRLEQIKQLKEPANVCGTPAEKGASLASWMLKCSPELRVKPSAALGGEQAKEAGTTIDGADVCCSDGDEHDDANPLRNYAGFVDLVIPCGPGVCCDTLREYMRHLGRPDLLHEIVELSEKATLEPKKSSARQTWQDQARGKCYMCKVAVQGFREQPWPICADCSNLNRRKCLESVDCRGKVAVVTGGRTKIGRECALRLLRNGATVVVTSRFPRGAAERYRREPDFANFREQLLVFGADFQRLNSVQALIEEVLRRFQRLDMLIHNAAQTIRRPPAYYEELVRRESTLAAQLTDCDTSILAGIDAAKKESVSVTGAPGLLAEAVALLPAPPEILPLLPQLPVACLVSDHEAELRKAEWFPAGQTDVHGEPLDLRPATSWTMKLEDTEIAELTEVLSVNLVVPYLLTAQWLPLLRNSDGAFVVFVSSQEGSFSTPSGSKSASHPHTNAAKAGLNMLARTIAGDLRKDAVFTCAVDPGWVSWMQPGARAAEIAPLTEADGAARVLDPVFSGLQALAKARCPPTGVLFKDFRVAAW